MPSRGQVSHGVRAQVPWACLMGVVLVHTTNRCAVLCQFVCVCVLQALFPDNTYSNDSGGDPAVIPELTFEQFQVCVSVCVSVCVLGVGDRGHRHIHPLACTCLCECLAGSKEGEGRL